MSTFKRNISPRSGFYLMSEKSRTRTLLKTFHQTSLPFITHVSEGAESHALAGEPPSRSRRTCVHTASASSRPTISESPIASAPCRVSAVSVDICSRPEILWELSKTLVFGDGGKSTSLRVFKPHLREQVQCLRDSEGAPLPGGWGAMGAVITGKRPSGWEESYGADLCRAVVSGGSGPPDLGEASGG